MRIRLKDRIGQTFRGVTILEYLEKRVHSGKIYVYFKVKCKCQNVFDIPHVSLFKNVDKPVSCGCIPKIAYNSLRKIKAKDNIGKIIREAKVINFIPVTPRKGKPNDDTKGKFICECSCSKLFEITYHGLFRDDRKHGPASCGCRRVRPKVEQRKYDTATYQRYYTSCKRGSKNRSKKRIIPFELSFEQFVKIVNNPCTYCEKITYRNSYKTIEKDLIKNTPFDTNKPRLDNVKKDRWDDVDKYTVVCSGVDRVDSSKGYEVGNCVPCCHVCNVMKASLSVEDFYSHIEQILSVKRKREVNNGI